MVIGVVELTIAKLEALLLNAELKKLSLINVELEELLLNTELLETDGLVELLLINAELLPIEALLATVGPAELSATEELNAVHVDDLEDELTDEELLLGKALHCPKPLWHVLASQ